MLTSKFTDSIATKITTDFEFTDAGFVKNLERALKKAEGEIACVEFGPRNIWDENDPKGFDKYIENYYLQKKVADAITTTSAFQALREDLKSKGFAEARVAVGGYNGFAIDKGTPEYALEVRAYKTEEAFKIDTAPGLVERARNFIGQWLSLKAA